MQGLGTSLLRLIPAYLVGSLMSGMMAGAMSGIVRGVVGAAFVGFVAAIPISYIVFLAADNPWGSSSVEITIVTAIVIGPISGVWLWRHRGRFSGVSR